MGKFTASITGRDEKGKRYLDRQSVRRQDMASAKEAFRDTALPGEHVVYVQPGGDGESLDTRPEGS
jgi:hypothetical protein